MSYKEPESSKEKRQHSTVLLPYSFYDCRIPESMMNVPMHWHGEFEINYILVGQGEFICGDDKFIVKEGDILIMPPDMLHSAYPIKDKLSYDAFVFSAEMLGSAGGDRASIECIRPVMNGSSHMKVLVTPSVSYYEDIKHSTDNIFKCVSANSSISDLLIKSELLRIFWVLSSNNCISPVDQDKISYTEIIRPAIEYMNTEYSGNITVEELASLVHLSKSYFMGCFRKATGIGAIEYLSQLRIKSACEMLGNSSASVADIALSCGFTNLSNFNRQFKKIVGCTPLKFRNK